MIRHFLLVAALATSACRLLPLSVPARGTAAPSAQPVRVTAETFRRGPLFVTGYRDSFDPKSAPSTLPATIDVTTPFSDYHAGVAEHVSYRVRLDGKLVGEVKARAPGKPTWKTDEAPAEIRLERTGVYTAELLVDGKPIGLPPARLAVGRVPCLGGEAESLLVVRPVGPSLDGETLTVWRWRRLDEPTPYLAEWRHDGKLVHSEVGFPADPWRLRERIESFDAYGGHRLSNMCSWGLFKEHYSLPSSLGAGSWSVRVVVDGEEAFEAGFRMAGEEAGPLVVRPARVSADEVKRLRATPPPPFVRPSGANPLLAVTPEEIRALTRSEEATRLREDANTLRIERQLGLGATVESVDDTAGRDRLSRKERQRLMDEAVDDVVAEHARETRKNQAEAKRAAKKLQKLIPALAGPWRDGEHPVNHSSMLY